MAHGKLLSHACSAVSFSDPQWLPWFTCVLSISPQAHSQSLLLISSCSLQFFIAIPRKKQNKQKRKANFQTDFTLPLGFPETDNLWKDIQTYFAYFLMSTSLFQTCYCRFPFLSMGENNFKGVIHLTHFVRMKEPPHQSGLFLSTAVIEGLTKQL